MNERKHTPGPWGLSRSVQVWVMAGPIHVATIPRAYDGDWSPANADLIAAAPDLLESLEELVALIHRQHDFNDDGDGKAIDRAEAAIAKAKGGAS